MTIFDEIDWISWNRSFPPIPGQTYDEIPAPHRDLIKQLPVEHRRLVDQWEAYVRPPDATADHPGFPCEVSHRPFEGRSFREANVATKKWLHRCGVPFTTQCYAFFDYGHVLAMPWKIVVRYWNVLFAHCGYAVWIWDRSAQWSCMFHHEEVILFGSYRPLPGQAQSLG